MPINTQNSRHLIKRSTLTGVIPTVPTSADFTDGTWLNTDTRKGEFFLNLADEKLWIGVNSGFKSLISTFAEALSNDNTTGANNISIDTLQSIVSGNGGGQIDLDFGGSSNEILISTDNATQSQSYLYLSPTSFVLSDVVSSLSSNGTDTLNLNSKFKTNIRVNTDFSINGKFDIFPADEIIFFTNNTSSYTTSNSNKPSVFIGADYCTNNGGGFGNIISGYTNTINSTYHCIITGGLTTITNSGFNSIMAGGGNTITDVTASLIVGQGHNITNVERSLIAGNNNSITTANDSLIIGNNNIVSFAVVNNSIIGGHSNIIAGPGAAFNVLLIGQGNKMINNGIMYGDAADGSGTTGSIGFSSYGNKTTNATPVILRDAVNVQQFIIDTNTSNDVTIKVVAINTSTGATKQWSATALVKNIAGTMTVVGGLTFTSTYGDGALAATTVTAALNSTNKTLEITVTGLASTNINWVADIKYVLARM